MKIAIVNLGSISDNIESSSVIRGINKQNIDSDITFVTNYECIDIYRHNKNVSRTISFNEFKNKKCFYDLLINLYPIILAETCPNIELSDAIGFNYCEEFDKFKDVFLGKKKYGMNIFQLYYKLSGLVWKGEGYDLNYYPRSKSKKNRAGIAVANINLKNYILDELKLDNSKVWNLPYKKNIFKKMDEINKCKRIITDDIAIFHLAISLRKYVYFLKTFPLNLKLELFKSGEIYDVPLNTIG